MQVTLRGVKLSAFRPPDKEYTHLHLCRSARIAICSDMDPRNAPKTHSSFLPQSSSPSPRENQREGTLSELCHRLSGESPAVSGWLAQRRSAKDPRSELVVPVPSPRGNPAAACEMQLPLARLGHALDLSRRLVAETWRNDSARKDLSEVVIRLAVFSAVAVMPCLSVYLLSHCFGCLSRTSLP